MSNSSELTGMQSITDLYGENVFSLKVMRGYLSDKAFKSLSATIKEGGAIDPKIADEVADAMKAWAIAKGATHYTHWFQPLTGSTAEKHDSFISPDGEGGVLLKFSGKELIQGEPDASSFPSGGLRATFEARGYTGWDPTSPAFVKESPQGSTLCIPSVFCGWHGEALDKKTPLLRSMGAVNKQVTRLAKLFGIATKGKRAYTTLGGEQEYFLIDREYYYRRLDLMQTGRTLFGIEPAKHQQLADHYFGAIKSRVIAYMEDLDRELWKLGIPAKTRHNEVSPAQFEIAPIFEEQNLGVDHNMMTMEVMRDVAERHGLVCLLHEKPFHGVNGSGKHNNWAVTGPDGKNWLSPGDNPRENAKFLTVVSALIKGVDTYAGILRAAIASPGNDHRLGSHEAPPAIISIFLGEELMDVFEHIETGKAVKKEKGPDFIHVGVDSLPPLPRDTTDRNRTSPFAFTGNKFEFRAVGSSMSLAGPNIVLNTIFAKALDEMCTKLEKDVASGKDFNESLQKLLQSIIKKHKRVLFVGDNYSSAWVTEAKKRGLPNLKTTPEALKEMKTDAAVDLFESQGVLTKRELASRVEVYTETYDMTVDYEAKCTAHMTKTMIIPVALEYQEELADTISAVKAVAKTAKIKGASDLLGKVCVATEDAFTALAELEDAIGGSSKKVFAAMQSLRGKVDALEALVPADKWPLPSYAEMLFVM